MPPAVTAITGRPQLRGSRSARSSESESSSAQSESSLAAASVTAERVVSTLTESFSGGSIGCRASVRSLSTGSVTGGLLVFPGHRFLMLLDLAVDQHLGRAVV